MLFIEMFDTKSQKLLWKGSAQKQSRQRVTSKLMLKRREGYLYAFAGEA
jgi:hypothetical protein